MNVNYESFIEELFLLCEKWTDLNLCDTIRDETIKFNNSSKGL